MLALTAKVKKGKRAADVAKAVSACETGAAVATAALAKLSEPQLAYSKALSARDALLPEWTKAMARLRTAAAVAWFDDPARLKAVFAAPDRVQAPVRSRAKPSLTGACRPVAPSPTPPPAATP